jgi:hypothetical protein
MFLLTKYMAWLHPRLHPNPPISYTQLLSNMGDNIRDTIEYGTIGQLESDSVKNEASKQENDDEHTRNGSAGQSALEGVSPAALRRDGEEKSADRGSRSSSGTNSKRNGRSQVSGQDGSRSLGSVQDDLHFHETGQGLAGGLAREIADESLGSNPIYWRTIAQLFL